MLWNRHSYVSDELTHFVGRDNSEQEQYELLVAIVNSGQLLSPNFQAKVHHMNPYASLCGNQMYVPSVVCFCDIPVTSFNIHMSKYSRFGLAFKRQFLIGQGANPVLYVARDSSVPTNAWPQSQPVARPQSILDPYDQRPPAPNVLTRCEYFDIMARIFHSAFTIEMALTPANQTNSNGFKRLQDLNTFVSLSLMAYIKFFDSGLAPEHPDNYYMEREWRVLGDVSFAVADITRVIVPRAYKSQVKRDLVGFRGKFTLV
jgi:Putative abortive phage resistance protein AbiGi, antitoxin